MITAKDIRVRSRYDMRNRGYEVQADTLIRSVAVVREMDIVNQSMSVEWMERRLKEEILHKVYGDIRARLRDDKYGVKFQVMDQEEPYLSKMQVVDLIDRVFNSVTNLIDEKMKVD